MQTINVCRMKTQARYSKLLPGLLGGVGVLLQKPHHLSRNAQLSRKKKKSTEEQLRLLSSDLTRGVFIIQRKGDRSPCISIASRPQRVCVTVGFPNKYLQPRRWIEV